MNSLINIGLYLTYFMVFSALLIIVFFAVKALVKNFKTAKSSLLGIAVLLILFLIAYGISPSTDVSAELFEKTATNPKYSKVIGAGLISQYLLMLGVFVALIYVRISKFFNR